MKKIYYTPTMSPLKQFDIRNFISLDKRLLSYTFITLLLRAYESIE